MAQPICPVTGCDRWSPGPKRPMCATHAARLRKYGDVMADKPLPPLKKSRGIPPTPQGRHLYLLQGVDGGSVKIGRSSDVVERLLQIQGSEKRRLRLVSVIPRGGPLETDVLAQFMTFQIFGEWFDPAPEIFEWFRVAEKTPIHEIKVFAA